MSPSRYEPFGLAALEAAGAEAALVLSEIPTYRELWEGAALFARADDPQHFAFQINALARDPRLRRRLGRRARRRAQRFTPTLQAQTMAAVYGQAERRPVCAGRGGEVIMRFAFYTHSLVSDWNHGNAHFLRGVMRELIARGHDAVAYEPAGAWSRQNLEADQGSAAISRFHRDFPELRSVSYRADFDHRQAVGGADVVIVHEWTEPAVIAAIGRLKRHGGRFTLLFHDTHHRAVTRESELGGLDLADYDGVLAFGETLSNRYRARGWGRRVFTWHEAADTRLFKPHPEQARSGDLVWIGNWGDDERTAELDTYLIEPVRDLGLRAAVRGVRYPADARARLAAAHISFGGWIANADVPLAFAANRVTLHVPRRPYVAALPGIPTIRMFEALACGIPLVSAPWDDCEALFRAGTDFLFARSATEMKARLAEILSDAGLARALSRAGLETIHGRHSCAHRVDELFAILAGLSARPASVLADRSKESTS